MRFTFPKKAIFALLFACVLTSNAVAAEIPYYLTIYAQNVALYEAETGKWYVTDTKVHSLPECDQQALLQGIPLETAQAATAALEDFCS